MEFRQLGDSGFMVPVLSLGTGTFGGGGELFKAWGTSDVAEATRLVDICLEAGLTMFDSADVYSGGLAEEILGQAIKGSRDQVLISTKATFRFGPGPERRRLIALLPDPGRRGEPAAAGHRLHRSFPAPRFRCAHAGRGGAGHARRPGPRRQDPLHRLLEFLGLASDEVAGRFGEIRARPLRGPPGLLLADRPRFRVGAHAAGARPEGGHGGLEPAGLGPAHGQDPRGQPLPEISRLKSQLADMGPPVPRSISTGSSTPSTRSPRRPARPCRKSRSTGCCSGRPCPRHHRRANEEQLRQNLGAVGWTLTPEQIARLDAASATTPGLSLLAPDRLCRAGNPPPV